MTTSVKERNFFTHRQARQAGDAFLALSKTPAFTQMTRNQIAASLTGTLHFEVTRGNLDTLSEATGIPIPARLRINPVSPASIINRLTAIEEAITILYRFSLTLDNSSAHNTCFHTWLEHLKSLPTPEAP